MLYGHNVVFIESFEKNNSSLRQVYFVLVRPYHSGQMSFLLSIELHLPFCQIKTFPHWLVGQTFHPRG